MKHLFLSALLFCFFAPANKNTVYADTHTVIQQTQLINTDGKTIKNRFNTPPGFNRVALDTSSFGYYLRHFKLLAHNSPVLLYNGNLKGNQLVHEAVLDISVGKKDLQQCADAIMRLRAAYLWDKKAYNQIQFKLTNGFLTTYSKWAKGYRVKFNGNKSYWEKTAKPSQTYETFMQYMEFVFIYAGTLSLDRELKSKPLADISVGDVFIKGGSPGHAILVVDIAKNKAGETICMFAQSYMPAQQIHVLKNEQNKAFSPWYVVGKGNNLVTPEWTFEWSQLKTWE